MEPVKYILYLIKHIAENAINIIEKKDKEEWRIMGFDLQSCPDSILMDKFEKCDSMADTVLSLVISKELERRKALHITIKATK